MPPRRACATQRPREAGRRRPGKAPAPPGGASAWISGAGATRLTAAPERQSWRSMGRRGEAGCGTLSIEGRRHPRRDLSHHAAKRRGRPARAESSQANPKAATDRGRAAMARRTNCTLSCLERHGCRVLPRIESRLRGEWAPHRVADGLGHRPKRPAASSRTRSFPWTPRRVAPFLPAHGPLCSGKRCFGLSRDGNRPGAGVHAHERKTETRLFLDQKPHGLPSSPRSLSSFSAKAAKPFWPDFLAKSSAALKSFRAAFLRPNAKFAMPLL